MRAGTWLARVFAMRCSYSLTVALVVAVSSPAHAGGSGDGDHGQPRSSAEVLIGVAGPYGALGGSITLAANPRWAFEAGGGVSWAGWRYGGALRWTASDTPLARISLGAGVSTGAFSSAPPTFEAREWKRFTRINGDVRVRWPIGSHATLSAVLGVGVPVHTQGCSWFAAIGTRDGAVPENAEDIECAKRAWPFPYLVLSGGFAF